MLSDLEILTAVQAEADDALGYKDELDKKRRLLLDYYNGEPYGDEIKGRSRFVSSDVSDVVEWMLPSLLRVFTQGNEVATFHADTIEDELEADQKTKLCNYVFYRQNDGVLTLHNMFKDALLQYTGVVKVYWKDDTEVTYERYRGLSSDELAKLESDPDVDIKERSESMLTVKGAVVDVELERTQSWGHIQYDNIPPEEFVIARDARDFVKPRFIGHVTPKTRSDLLEMGFDKEAVWDLPKYGTSEIDAENYTRRYGYSRGHEDNPTTVTANDVIQLGEYYAYLDVDEDGTSELWQVFVAGNTILEKNRWDRHPFAVIVPVPLPHRAIGTCPADQTADLQYVNSVLGRQALDNIYSTNYQRMAYNDRVDLDDLFTPRPGGGIYVEGQGDIGGALQPITTIPQTDGILQMIEYINNAREVRTGVTRYNQGLDTDSLNKTATGFKGIMDASQQRMELIARIFAETGVRDIFRLTSMLLAKYQKESVQVRITGQPMEIDPGVWAKNLDCHVAVGLGSGDRNEKIANLSYLYDIMTSEQERGSLLADDAKKYELLERVITEIGLKDAKGYFNDPAKPEEVLQAENEQLTQAVEMLSQQQNPLAEAELIKVQGQLAQADAKLQADMQKFVAEQLLKDKHFRRELALKLTELELEHREDVPGSLV